jgi:hypothetical protein
MHLDLLISRVRRGVALSRAAWQLGSREGFEDGEVADWIKSAIFHKRNTISFGGTTLEMPCTLDNTFIGIR